MMFLSRTKKKQFIIFNNQCIPFIMTNRRPFDECDVENESKDNNNRGAVHTHFQFKFRFYFYKMKRGTMSSSI